MNANTSDPSRISPAALRALVISSLVAVSTPLIGAEDAKPPADTSPAEKSTKESATTEKTEKTGLSLDAAPGEFSNSVTLGVGSFFVDGNDAQFQRQLQHPAGVYGGIEELHYEQAVGKKGLLQIDGNGIFDNHNYGLQLDLSNPEIGYVRAGYSEGRTWYDGSGGYSPNGDAWVQLYDDELFIDRRRAWIEGGLTLPNWPVFTVRYNYDSRAGLKDSTSWGDYNLTQDPAKANLKYITPTFLGIDENRHTFDVDGKHTLGNTTFGIGLRYELDELDNTRNIMRRAGEPTLQRAVTSSDNTSADFWNFHAFTETRFNPKVLFTTGYSYTRMDTDLAGSRIFGATYGSQFSPTYPNKQNGDEGFYDLDGGSRVDQFVANFNLMLTPWKHVTIVPSVRVEHQEQVGEAMFTETRATANDPRLTEILNERVRRFTDVTEALAARYTGLTNWAFYARGEWLQGEGTLRESEFDVEDEGVGPVQLQRDTESTRRVQKYTVGANWYPHRKVNTAVEYYYRIRENDYDHVVDTAAFPASPSNLYPAFILNHEFDTHDVNFRLTLRPVTSLTLVSRYDYQTTAYHTLGGVNNTGIVLGDVESALMNNHILSQSVGWTPIQQLYFQGSISYAFQRTDSPVADTTGAGAYVVQDAENDYWNASLTVGCVLSARSDLQAQYVFYRADNYSDNSLVGFPYGAGAEQHGVTTTLITRLRKNLIWKLQYGYYTGHDETSGGNNDYSAHLVYSSLQYLF